MTTAPLPYPARGLREALALFRGLLAGVILFLCSLISAPGALGQIGGRYSHTFLNMPQNAKVAALGGVNVSSAALDPDGLMTNPASMALTPNRALSLGYHPFAGLWRQSVAGLSMPVGTNSGWGAMINSVGYGQIDAYSVNGDPEGTVSAHEISLAGGYATQRGPFALGGTLKLAASYLAQYQSYALMADLGALYRHPTQDLTVGLVTRNVGALLTRYAAAGQRLAPVDVTLGASYRFVHMPLRMSLTAHNLQTWDVVYPTGLAGVGRVNALGEPIEPRKPVSEMIFRHLVFGGEFLLSKNLHLRAGYNHLRRKELKADSGPSGSAGYSIGTMIRIRSLTFNYTYLFMNQAAGGHFLGLSLPIGRGRVVTETPTPQHD